MWFLKTKKDHYVVEWRMLNNPEGEAFKSRWRHIASRAALSAMGYKVTSDGRISKDGTWLLTRNFECFDDLQAAFAYFDRIGKPLPTPHFLEQSLIVWSVPAVSNADAKKELLDGHGRKLKETV